MTAKTTVNIAAVNASGGPDQFRTIDVRLVHGGAGGTVDGLAITDEFRVRLDDDGEGTIDLYPNSAITPAGTYYLFTAKGVTPAVVRAITVPTSGPVDWTDDEIQVEDPSPPVIVPAPQSGDAFDVIHVDEEGLRYTLGQLPHYFLSGLDAGNQHPIAAIEGLQDALDAAGTSARKVGVFLESLNASGGGFTNVTFYESTLTIPRTAITGIPVFVAEGPDKGPWTMTASGPCTAITASPADIFVPVGGGAAFRAQAVSSDGVTISDWTVEAVGFSPPQNIRALLVAQAEATTAPSQWAECGLGLDSGDPERGYWSNTTRMASFTDRMVTRAWVRCLSQDDNAELYQETHSEALDDPLGLQVPGAGGDWDRFEDALRLESDTVKWFAEETKTGGTQEWWKANGYPIFAEGEIPVGVWVELLHERTATGFVYKRIRSDVGWDHTEPDGSTWRTIGVQDKRGTFTMAASNAVAQWVGRGGGRFDVARVRAWVDGDLEVDFDPSTVTVGATAIPDGVAGTWNAALNAVVGGGDSSDAVPSSRTIAGLDLSTNRSASAMRTALDVYATGTVDTAIGGRVPTTRTVAGVALSSDITAAALNTALGGRREIDRRTLASPSASESFTFTGYSYVVAWIAGRNTSTGNATQGVRQRFNSDTGNNYSASGGALQAYTSCGTLPGSQTNTNRSGYIRVEWLYVAGAWLTGEFTTVPTSSTASTGANSAAGAITWTGAASAAPTTVEFYFGTGSFDTGTQFILEGYV